MKKWEENSRLIKKKKKCHKDLAPKMYVFLTKEKAEIGKKSASATAASEFEL